LVRFVKLAPSLALLLLATAPALADPELTAVEEPVYKCNAKQSDVTITFKPDMEVKELVTWAVGFTCKKFMYDARILPPGKKVTVIAPQKLSREDAYQVFLAALSTAGLAVVPRGSALAIVDSQSAKKESVPIYRKELPPSSEQVVRYVVRPTYVQADTLKTAFAALKSDAGDIISVGQLVLITDYASHVRDMASLLSLIDVPGGTDGIYTIPVLHADAAKLSE
jgi:general secretion pathway protein D